MRCLVAVLFLVAACSPGGESSTSTTTTTTTEPTTSTTVEETTTTTRLTECAPPPYRVEVLPDRVEPTVVDPDDLDRNEYLEIAGTSSTIWLDGDGELAVALIRGTLPLEMWPGDSGIVSIDGVSARVGPFDDGSWVVGWAEPPEDRCDQFTMVFFPPVEPEEVEATLTSMDRTAG